MPNKDGSGPNGEGSISGRGAGNCTNRTGSPSLGRRRFNRVGGRRRSGDSQDNQRFGFEEELNSLKTTIKSISDRLDALKKD